MKKKIKKILLLFVGQDKWREEVHKNNNILARESLKTTVKARKLNKVLTYHKDNAYYLARGMQTKHYAS